jgi:hypothetical protein
VKPVEAGKRSVQVNVRMSHADLATLEQAAGACWPRAILSRSAAILGLAKMAAEDVLQHQADAAAGSPGQPRGRRKA